MSDKKTFTTEQIALLKELTEAHVLDVSQISFEGSEAMPIFDYEAVCALSLKLTDIQNIDCELSERDFETGIVTARCTVTLPDGRSRTSEDSAQIDDTFSDGKKIGNMRTAELVAQARAVRRGIRSVGVNLFRAHQQFMKTGKPAAGHTNNDPRHPQYQQIGVLAGKLGLKISATIDGAKVENRSEYEKIIAENFDGRTSTKDLNDFELQRFIILLRTLENFQNARTAVSQKQAA